VPADIDEDEVIVKELTTVAAKKPPFCQVLSSPLPLG
jgi:hypothetical protein